MKYPIWSQNITRWGLVAAFLLLSLPAGAFYQNEIYPPAGLGGSHFVPVSGEVEAVFSPNGGCTRAIVNAIREARVSIFVQAYGFTSREIAGALIRAKRAGVNVVAVMDKVNTERNGYSVIGELASAGIPIRIDYKVSIAHNKVMIIDQKTVITGSFNFTTAAEYRNAENVLIIRNNPGLAGLYMKNWQWRWNDSK